MINRIACRCIVVGVWFAAVPAANAQWAVVDAPAMLQLVQQVQTMTQQLQTARNQLTQAQQALQTMTGARGMQNLLSGTARNYLPSNWTQLSAAMLGDAAGSALGGDVRAALTANAVLTPGRLAALSTADQQRIIANRQLAALQQALAQAALANSSSRFAAIQTLVSTIGSAVDQKAILDLQARIAAELGMLQNEQTKLQSLQRATDARDAVNRQQAMEQAIEAHGRFETRFQPTP